MKCFDKMVAYKAKTARAAAPTRPAALTKAVGIAAAPVNCLTVVEAELEADVVADGVEYTGVVTAGVLVVAAGVVETGVVLTTVLKLELELLAALAQGYQPSVFAELGAALEDVDDVEFEVVDTEEVEDVDEVVEVVEVVEVDDVVEVEEVVVVEEVEELDDPQEGPALTENWVESGNIISTSHARVRECMTYIGIDQYHQQ